MHLNLFFYYVPDIDIKYTLPKLHNPPIRKTPHNIMQSESSFSRADPRSLVLVYIISNTLPSENGTAMVTLDDITRKSIAPGKLQTYKLMILLW